MLSGGYSSWGVFAPLLICSRAGTEGGRKEAPLIVNLPVWTLCATASVRVTSASPGVGTPGAAGLVRGCRSVSRNGLVFGVWVVFGSSIGASVYRKMAEFMPPSNGLCVFPMGMLGSARIQ